MYINEFLSNKKILQKNVYISKFEGTNKQKVSNFWGGNNDVSLEQVRIITMS